jgi:hypothetical protein
VRHRLKHALVIDAGRLGDQIELVGGGEFDVAVGVAEQLGEFRLYGRNHHHFRRDALEQRRRFALGVRRGAADDLRHVAEFLEPVALNHAFRAERHLQAAALGVQIGREPVGGAGEHGRAQHDELPVGKRRQQRVDAILDDLADRIEELVDGRADGDDDRTVAGDAVGRVGEDETPVNQCSARSRRRAR